MRAWGAGDPNENGHPSASSSGRFRGSAGATDQSSPIAMRMPLVSPTFNVEGVNSAPCA